jgi:anti-anti-sigma factor
MGACVSGVIFLPPRPKRRHIYLVVSRLRSALRRGPTPWRRAPNDARVAADLGRPAQGELRVRRRHRHRHRDGRYTIAVSGALNASTRDRLVEGLEDALEDDAGEIVLDLSALEAIDHPGLGTILTAHLRASDELKLLVIVPGPEPVQRVIDAVQGPFLYVSRRGDRTRTRARSRFARAGVPSRSGRQGERPHSVRRSG